MDTVCRILNLLFWVAAIVSGVKSTHHFDIESSEDQVLDQQEQIMSYHKPLLSHYLSPFIHHPWIHKLPASLYIKEIKPTVTSTKTIVVQTLKHEKKHLVCYKAPHGLPPCLPDSRENDYISPTSVPKFPGEMKTQILGYLEGGELKQDNPYNQQKDIEWEQRHLFGKGFYKHTKYITKTLCITRVEDYINTQVTATLLPLNCVPSHANIPPCPEHVEQYVHYDLSHAYKPVWQRHNKALYEGQKEGNREISKEFVLEGRSRNESVLNVSENIDEERASN